jgi:hypothetical protein
MMKSQLGRSVIFGVIAMASLSNVLATDVGMPTYSTDLGKNANLEFYYEKFDRKVKGNIGDVTLSNTQQEENRFMARFNYNASTRASMHAEVGATDSEGSDGAVPIYGAGLKVKAYDSKALQLSVFAAGTYVSGIEYSEEGSEDYYYEYPSSVQEESYLEINGGLAISRLLQLDEKTTCTPYGGFMVSKLDGSEDVNGSFRDGETISLSGDIKDDGLFSIFAGLGLTMDKTFGIRLEGRFVNQTSFSAGFTYFF